MTKSRAPFSLQELVLEAFPVGQTFGCQDVQDLLMEARQKHGLMPPHRTAAGCLLWHMENRGFVRRVNGTVQRGSKSQMLWEMICHDSPRQDIRTQAAQLHTQEQRRKILEAWEALEPSQRREWLSRSHTALGVCRETFLAYWAKMCRERPDLLPASLSSRSGWATPQEVEQTPTPEGRTPAERAHKMLDLGFSQIEVARRLGVSRQCVWEWERRRIERATPRSGPTPRKYTRHDTKAIAALIEQGKTAAEISALMGVPRMTVYTTAKSHGLDLARAQTCYTAKAIVRAAFEDGRSFTRQEAVSVVSERRAALGLPALGLAGLTVAIRELKQDSNLHRNTGTRPALYRFGQPFPQGQRAPERGERRQGKQAALEGIQRLYGGGQPFGVAQAQEAINQERAQQGGQPLNLNTIKRALVQLRAQGLAKAQARGRCTTWVLTQSSPSP